MPCGTKIRNLSPPEWNAPGIAQLALLVTASACGPNPIPIDSWISSYSPLANYTTQLASGFNPISTLDYTKTRIFIFIPPRGNAVSLVLKGITGDTGLNLNPNGPIVLTIPPSGAPASIGITAGSAVPGCRVIII